jgi:SpoIID/LytB domain protein
VQGSQAGEPVPEPMRRSLAFAAVLAALTAGLAVRAGSAPAASVCSGSCFAAPAGSGALFLFSGHGWGHGVGMSQYGAYGYAQHGSTFEQILAHYYPGTKLGPAPVSSIRVLLADKRKTLKLSSSAAWTVRDDAGKTVRLAPGQLTVAPSLRIAGRALAGPLVFTAGKASPLTLKLPYRGRIEVDVVDGRLRAINVVPLEQYLYGVVPSEMPSTWAPEALKAQAVAARSYALATRAVGAPFDVYSDTRSQMYLGLSHESAAATAAVNATKRQVLFYGGTIATTYFSSTSGGRTESSQGWTGTAVPYLVSVADPYDDISPYHDWGPVPVTAKAIKGALKLPTTVTDATTTLDGGGRVALLSFLTPFSPMPVSGAKLRSAIGLRSTWFTVGVMSLAPPAPNPPVVYGSSVTLAGVVRGVGGVTLEQRPLGGQWQPVGPVASGAARLSQKPSLTTDYRLATAAAAAGSVRIRVAPSVTLTSFTAAEVTGSVLPVLPATAVQVQAQGVDATSWTTVATGTPAADGTFSIAAQLTPGDTYRVSVVPPAGYAPATTPAQIVAR